MKLYALNVVKKNAKDVRWTATKRFALKEVMFFYFLKYVLKNKY